MRKNQNNKSSYGIEVFLENKALLFHTPIKFNVLQWILLLGKRISYLTNRYVVDKMIWQDKIIVNPFDRL
jgi:hypothetical protein